MNNTKIRYFTAGFTLILLLILMGATTVTAKADTEAIAPGAESRHRLSQPAPPGSSTRNP